MTYQETAYLSCVWEKGEYLFWKSILKPEGMPLWGRMYLSPKKLPGTDIYVFNVIYSPIPRQYVFMQLYSHADLIGHDFYN